MDNDRWVGCLILLDRGIDYRHYHRMITERMRRIAMTLCAVAIVTLVLYLEIQQGGCVFDPVVCEAPSVHDLDRIEWPF